MIVIPAMSSEREPDEALARIALGDEQGVLAEVGEADRQVEVRDTFVSPADSRPWKGGSIGRPRRPPDDAVRKRDQDAAARGLLV